MRARLTARVARSVAAAGAVILLLGVVVGPSLASAARSPGCTSWNDLGVSGWTPTVVTIPGPFFEGETLRYRIEDSSIGDVFYLMTTDDEFLFTTTTKGNKTFVLPKDVDEVRFNGGGSPPASWFLSHFSCAAAGAEPPDTATIGAPESPRQDRSLALVLLALAAGSMLLASRRVRP